ncbi:hypothetical protein BGZ98_006102, partial [Dissophora globulifera]
LFSTSPKFTAKSPFTSPGLGTSPSFNPTSVPASTSPVKWATVSSTLAPLPSTVLSPEQVTRSTLIAVSDGPLSISTTPPPLLKSSDKSRRQEQKQELTVPVSPASSIATFATAMTSQPDEALEPSVSSAAVNTMMPSTVNMSSKPLTMDSESKSIKSAESTTNFATRRRVPRGLFSSASTPGLEPIKLPSVDSEFRSSSTSHHTPRGQSEDSGQRQEGNAMHRRKETPRLTTEGDAEANGMTSSQFSAVSSSHGSLFGSSSSQPQSPHSPITSAFSSPTTSGLKSPASPLQRSQPKPSPIQTKSVSTVAQNEGEGNKRSKSHGQDEDGISQLVKDLERAMNPTPTEPSPKPYFLQGKGLLQRIPSQVSMDDGLLDEDGEVLPSEDSDRGDTEGEGPSLSRGSGSLRRRRSGSKRQVRISRSRSRNRSKGRQESRVRPALTPIEVGYPSALVSSEWPFDRSPPRGRTMTPSTSAPQLSTQRRQLDSASVQQRHSQGWQPGTGPHLPFAESVAIGNPIRVGKGIASFTVYTITLKLCDPARAVLHPPPASNRLGEGQGHHRLHAGHAPERSAATRPEHSHAQEHRDEAPRVVREAGDSRPLITKAPSKASIMLTRSLSSPDLAGSAERLLMSIREGDGLLPPLPAAAALHSQTIADSRTNTAGMSMTGTAAAAATTPGRIIHVRKRYSDFVAMRAQLVELLKDTSRNEKRGQQQQHQQRSLQLPQSVSPYNSASMSRSRIITDHEDMNDDDDDDEQAGLRAAGSGMHSRYGSEVSTASGSNSGVSCASILRGMPKLPPKKVVGKFRPAFVEKRRRELEYFLEWIVAHPIVGDCPVVVRWFLG